MTRWTHRAARATVLAAGAALLTAACSSTSSGGSSGTTAAGTGAGTTASTVDLAATGGAPGTYVPPGTLAPPGTGVGGSAGTAPTGSGPKATATAETEVSGAYRQGLASLPTGWIFSTNNALYKTDPSRFEIAKNEQAIPAEWAAKGYDHVGDVDVVGNTVYAPVEQPNYDAGTQAMFRYDATTLQFIDAVEVKQHHNSFVSVDPVANIAYSTDQFTDHAIVRYDLNNNWAPLPPITLDREVGHIQGGDLARGAFWLATDDEVDGIYRVDLQTGHVDLVAGSAHPDGEGEGIDATELPSGLLHVISIDAALLPVRVTDYTVAS